MVNASFKKYASYQDFITDVMFNVLDETIVSIIVNYNDYQGVLVSLFEKTINGKSLYLNAECADCIDDDIATAQMNDGNMLITIYNGEIIGEPVVFKNESAFDPDAVYYIEYDAKSALDYPLKGTIIPFQIAKEKI